MGLWLRSHRNLGLKNRRLNHGPGNRSRQISANLKPEIVSLQLELLNIALSEQGEELVKLIVI